MLLFDRSRQMVISHSSSRCYPLLVFNMFTAALRYHVIFRIVFSTSFVLDVRGESLSSVEWAVEGWWSVVVGSISEKKNN
jgi:hypothetical protein